MATWKLGPALAAGNTVVLKPSELTPLTALRLAEITADILPKGVLNVVTGQGETAGDALVRHPDVAMVSLTGSVETGKVIARTAAETLKRVHLELGGKAPVIVFDDADVEAAVACLTDMAYYNSGQDCTAPCRLMAGPGVFDDLVSGLTDAVGKIVTGDPFDDATAMGPVISADQLDRVGGMVARAVAGRRRGHRRRRRARPARVLLRAVGGGEPGPGQRDRPARGVRPGGVDPALRRRGAGARVGQRRRLRALRERVDERRRPGDAHERGARTSAACG